MVKRVSLENGRLINYLREMIDLLKKFLKNYKDENFYIRKKAEYVLFIVLTMMGAVVLSILTEIFIEEDLARSISIAISAMIVFCLVLIIIHFGRYEIGVNLLILLGFLRLHTIFYFDTPFQFYVTLTLILLAVNIVYYKKYQLYLTEIASILLLILQSIRIAGLVESGALLIRSFYEAALSIYIYLAIILILKYIRIIIDKEINEREELLFMAERDSLTAIFNRRKITEHFNDYIEQNQTFRIILLDIDDFKSVNDNYGHNVGDIVLIELANLIVLDYKDASFARWGGEEFLLIIEEENDIADDIRTLIMNYTFTQGIKLTISLGQTIVTKEDTIVSAVKRADEAMYMSKKSGKNKVTVS